MSENIQLPPPDTSVKVPHLDYGLLFLGLAGVWALVSSGAIDADSLPLIGPGVLIAAGVVGLVASLANGRNRSRRARITTESTDSYTQTFAGDTTTEDTTTYDTDTTEEIR
jgi:hypothetical protein